MSELDSTLPLVSVVTPAYNSAAFIEETIQSVLEQDYSFLEYLVMDGGSTDGTLEILKRYNNRVDWISEPDKGQTDALIKGFKRAHGRIVSWLNADDIYMPGVVRRAVNYLVTHPEIDVIYSDCQVIDSSGQVLQTWRTRSFSLVDLARGECFIYQPTVFIRRSALEAVGGLDESLHYVMDYDLWLRLGVAHRFGALPGIGAQFRVHPGSKTATNSIKFHAERIATLERFFATPSLPRAVRAVREEAFARAFITVACNQYELGDIPAAQADLAHAASLSAALFKDPEQFLPLIIGNVSISGNPVDLIQTVFDYLPPQLEHIGAWRRRALNWAQIAYAFILHRQGNKAGLRRILPRAILLRPQWLLNRGVLVMLRDSFVLQ
jgi:glycosyltransferase involved in cell wall biosynthesis